MTSSRFTRVTVLSLLTMLVFSGTAVAQAEGRTPMDMALSMTGAPHTLSDTTDFEAPENVFLLGSGTASSTIFNCVPTPCAEASQTSFAWVSDPLFNETNVPGSFVGMYDVAITLAGNQGSQPVAQGPVTFNLEFGRIDPGQAFHGHGQASATVNPDAPSPVPPGTIPGVPAGVLSSPVVLTMDMNASALEIQAGGRLAITLSVSMQGPADFTMTTDGFPTLQYYYGDPDEADLDGDGIPNSIDDDADGDGALDSTEQQVGSDPLDPNVTPASESSTCPGFTYQEAFEETGDPNTCPVVGGFPWLILIAIILVVVLLLGGGFAVLTVAGRKVRITVSHDGFQAIEQGQTAEYELELVATGKKEEIVPVELALKGVPEDWSATLEPAHLTLYAGGEEPEPQTAILRLAPPADEQYESEAQVVVTATPTDEEGKTSALNPGSSVKTKTIVNIGMTDPEGGKKKRKAKRDDEPDEGEEAAEADDEDKPKRGGFLKRKKKDEEPEEAADEEQEPPATEPAAAAAPAAAGKPQIGMGKMSHDPEDFSEGDQVTTTVTVRNKGDGPVEGLRLNLFVNDEKADTQEVALGAGDSTEVTFQWTAQPDENRVRIKGGLKGA